MVGARKSAPFLARLFQNFLVRDQDFRAVEWQVQRGAVRNLRTDKSHLLGHRPASTAKRDYVAHPKYFIVLRAERLALAYEIYKPVFRMLPKQVAHISPDPGRVLKAIGA